MCVCVCVGLLLFTVSPFPLDKEKWFPAHGPTDYERWLRESDTYQVAYQLEYEPYFVVHRDHVPL